MFRSSCLFHCIAFPFAFAAATSSLAGSAAAVNHLAADSSEQPTVKTYVEPWYPDEQRRAGIGGVVALTLEIGTDGKVTRAQIRKGVHPDLDQAALEAARRLEFHPARPSTGQTGALTLEFEYRFSPPGHSHTEPAQAPRAIALDPSAVEVQAVETVSVVESVEDERPLSAASARTVRDRDLRLRPIQRPGDLLRVTPGLMVVQHAGGGKANQYLLRGFDADHGTDIALSFDGLPVNMVSHGHGQGYADTSWIIPELVERVDLSKGPYFVENGNFSTAGSVELASRDRGESLVSAGGGSFNTARAVGIAVPSLGASWHPLFAAEVVRTDGPFLSPEDLQKYNLFGKLTYDIDARSRASLATSAYNGSWNASGQLPTRAVQAGLVDHYGTLDPSEGGASSRRNLSFKYHLRPGSFSELSALAYLTQYDFTLYSNFTFFSRDPINGDGIEQWDSRTISGARVSYRWLRQWRGILFDSMVGGSARADSVVNGLAYARARQRLRRVVETEIDESSIGLYAKEEVQLTSWLRLVGGLRMDHFTFRVSDRLANLEDPGSRMSGSLGASQVSPKASLVLSPHPSTDVFVNYGHGFHSNDARGVVRLPNAVTPLARTVGYELGVRTRLADRRLELAAALWGIDLQSELVWVGDEGTTEEAGATRRLGVELEARLQVRTWLFADLDVTWADAAFRENAGNARAVALAPRLTVSGGLSALHGSGLRGGLRGLHIAKRPATKDGFLQAEATNLVDLFAAYRWRSLELSLTIENLLARPYKAAQFATVTRLPQEASTEAEPPIAACPAGTRPAADEASGSFRGCEDISFSPGNPFGFRVMVAYYF
jgi:TonB family protein